MTPDLATRKYPIPSESSYTVRDVLRERVLETPRAAAILAPGREDLPYHALLEQIGYTVDALNGLGLGRGDRVAVALPAGPECPVALVSIMAGSVCVPLNPGYSAVEFGSAFTNTRSAALVTQSAFAPEAVRAARQCGIPVIELERLSSAGAGRFVLRGESRNSTVRIGYSECDELAVVFATSGTTSSPKLIPLTQRIVCCRARRARFFVDLTPADRCLDLMPSFHGGALLISILGSLFAGAGIACPGAVSGADLEPCIRAFSATWCAMPPALLATLLSRKVSWQHGGPPAGLRAFFTTGAPVSRETVAAIEQAFGIPLQNCYGATECGGVAANPLPPGLRKSGSVGIGIGPDLAVLDESGNPLQAGQTGEVIVRGPGVFTGYENDDGSGHGPFHGDWYRTADRGYLDADGYLFLTGRLGEIINRGGEKIAPEEVEEQLRKHPAVQDAVVFPIPHEVLGQDVAALIVSRESGLNAKDVRHFLAERLAAFKVPRVILTVAAIRAGPGGKIQRRQLAERYVRELAVAMSGGAGVYVAPRSPVEERLAGLWGSTLKTSRIGIRDSFFDCGGDSLLATQMLAEVERTFGRRVAPGRFLPSATIENLAALLADAEHGKASLLLPIRTAGHKPPLFYVLPGWFVREAEHLGRHLGPDQPLYALIPDPRPNAAQSGMGREEIVAECVAAMESVQQDGPYFVMGRSAAGIVAIEIAHSLRNKGREVGMVGLLDTHYPGVLRGDLLPTPLRQIEYHTGELIKLPQSRWAAYLLGLPFRALYRRVCGKRGPPSWQDAPLYTKLELLFDEAPPSYPGRIVFFAAEASRHRGFLDRRLYWSQAAEYGVEMHLTPGDHNMMVQEPYVREFAAVLRGCLERAREQPSAARENGEVRVSVSGATK